MLLPLGTVRLLRPERSRRPVPGLDTIRRITALTRMVATCLPNSRPEELLDALTWFQAQDPTLGG